MWLTILPLLGLLSTKPPPSLQKLELASAKSMMQEAEHAHDAEVASSKAALFLGAEAAAEEKVGFTIHDVGESFAGPDSKVLGSAAAGVHISAQPVLTAAECLSIRLEAKSALTQGLTSYFTYADLASVGEVNVADLPMARKLLRRKFASTLFPAVSQQFGLEASSLRVCDAVVVRYDAAKRATHQPMHADQGLVSFNIPLSSQLEYEGGGTCFEGTGDVLRSPMGNLLVHASGMRHAGSAIRRGVRWVLVVFLVASHVPQLARRCSNIASESMALAATADDQGDEAGAMEARQRAKMALLTAIDLAPVEDFQLHHDLGLLLLNEGDTAAAQCAFQRAAQLYPRCPRPHTAVGMLLSDANRHRAAFRRFQTAYEAVTQHGDGQDRNLALQVAVSAAHSVLTLHQRCRDSGCVEADTAKAVDGYVDEVAKWLRDSLANMDGIETEQTPEAQEMLRELLEVAVLKDLDHRMRAT